MGVVTVPPSQNCCSRLPTCSPPCHPTLQPDVLLNYSGKGLGELVAGRGALALSATVKLSFLVNGLLSLPMYLFPYQASGCWQLHVPLLYCLCAPWSYFLSG